MNEFFSRIMNQIREIYSKLDRTKKIIIGVVIGVVIVSFTVLLSVSHSEPNALLFADLSSDDFGQVTKKLEELGYYYETTGTTSIFVKPAERALIVTKLAQENMLPKGIPGFKLFDTSSWTETDKELDVKYMRALRGEIQRHIESLKNIDKASVEIAMSDDSIYSDSKTPYTAAVTVHLASGYDKLSVKEIKGITFLVSRAVGPRLKPEHVTVTDEFGKIISDFDDDFENEKKEYTVIEYRKKIEEQARVRVLKDIRDGLEKIYSPDRIQIVRLNMEFNWDKISEEQTEYTPITWTPDDPTVPYSTREVKESIPISSKKTQENFQGHGWNPEGPAGTDSNTPPGYKAADDQFAKYNKTEDVINNAVNKTTRSIARAPYDISRVSASIAIDGLQDLPRLPSGDYDLDPNKSPVQTPLTPEELKKAENIVRAAINFKLARGDQVTVENIMFDRSSYWASLRDEFKRKEQIKMLVLAILIALAVLFVGFVLFKAVQRELERRRRAREEALALEQQRMREAALKAAEDEGIDVELSLEERARLELQQSALQLAKERPDDVAKLLRTWLAEE
ncbi:MAG: flagellar M-ring protein FliF [Leptospirales bacterium]|nr:flagellar M-ring protein FliF [Leptospirales bacterium]